MPEIPDYERPELEKYEESDFTPTPYVKQELEFGQREPETIAKKTVEKPASQASKSEAAPAKPEEEPVKKFGIKKAAKPEETPEVVDNKRQRPVKNGDADSTPVQTVKEEADAGERESQKGVKKTVRKTQVEPKPEEKAQEKAAESSAKKLIKKPKKYEELPEIPDYERPALEVYEESDFTPTPYNKQDLVFGQREPENPPQKAKVQPEEKALEVPKVEEAEKPEPEKSRRAAVEKDKKTPEEAPAGRTFGKREPKVEEEAPKSARKVSTPKQPTEEELKKINSLRKLSIENPEGLSLRERVLLRRASRCEDMPEIPEVEKTPLEKYEKTEYEPTKKDAEKTVEKPVEKAAPKEEEIPNKNFKLGKGKPTPTPTPEESAEVTINQPKPKEPLKSSTGESADASILSKRLIPPTIVEESLSKDIVIKGEPQEMPIEIKITDTDEPTKKSVSFDQSVKAAEEERKRVTRRKYDPMAYVPDDDEAMEESPNPDPSPSPDSQSRSRPKYDPFKWVPDDDSNDTEVNTIQKPQVFYCKQNLRDFERF